MISFVHVFLSVTCLVVGSLIFFKPKGTNWHRAAGKVYLVSMIGLNATALAIYHLTGHFNLFHFTAILSLILVLTGWAQVLLRRRLRNWLYRHYMYMCWSYVALIAAALNESFVRLNALKALAHHTGNWLIMATQAVLLCAAAVVINHSRPKLLSRYDRSRISCESSKVL